MLQKLANPEILNNFQVGYVLLFKIFENVVEKTFRKSVFSTINFGLISPVHLCGTRKTITEPIRKSVAELQRPAPSRLCSYMKNRRLVITRSSPIQRP